MLDIVELTTLQKIEPVRGRAARFLFAPSIDKEELVGNEPGTRTMKRPDGVFVPTDSQSVEILSLYHHLELLMKFDARVGVLDLNIWPRTVAVNTQLVNAKKEQSQDNALYSGVLDAFLFVPYKSKDLPLSVNMGVLGHEHFHSLFYKLVLKKLGGAFAQTAVQDPHDSSALAKKMGLQLKGSANRQLTSHELYHMLLLRAMNEGLADIWGFLFSGDLTFVSRSIHTEDSRDLGQQADNIPSAEAWKQQTNGITKFEDGISDSYTLGRQYAQIVYSVIKPALVKSQASYTYKTDESRVQIGKSLIQVLKKLQAKAASLAANENLKPSSILEYLSEESALMTTESCQSLKEKVSFEPTAKVCGAQP